MAEKGWIKLHRSLQDCPMWYEERFSKGQAWVDLLLMANHSDKKILFNGDFIIVQRGQYLTSMVRLAEKWKWDRKTVSKFLKLLEKDKMVTLSVDNSRTLITIDNYCIYQEFTTDGMDNGLDKGMDNPMVNHTDNHMDKGMDTNNNVKNDKECNKNGKEDNYIYNTHEDDFGFKAEIAWNDTFAIYPRDEGYATAKQIWMNKLLDVIPQNREDMAKIIYKAVKAYVADYDSKHPKSENYKYARRFDKWLTEDCDYWISVVEKGERE